MNNFYNSKFCIIIYHFIKSYNITFITFKYNINCYNSDSINIRSFSPAEYCGSYCNNDSAFDKRCFLSSPGQVDNSLNATAVYNANLAP